MAASRRNSRTKKSGAKKTSTRTRAGARAAGSRKAKTRTRTSAKKSGTTRFGEAASKKVGRALHEMKRGKLTSGRSKKKVTSRKQAVAIGLSQARRRGAKVPPRSAG